MCTTAGWNIHTLSLFHCARTHFSVLSRQKSDKIIQFQTPFIKYLRMTWLQSFYWPLPPWYWCFILINEWLSRFFNTSDKYTCHFEWDLLIDTSSSTECTQTYWYRLVSARNWLYFVGINIKMHRSRLVSVCLQNVRLRSNNIEISCLVFGKRVSES